MVNLPDPFSSKAKLPTTPALSNIFTIEESMVTLFGEQANKLADNKTAKTYFFIIDLLILIINRDLISK
jgi:hypothetical protein